MSDYENNNIQFDPQDVQNNTAMGILAYLSWLVLIPLFAAKDSKYARFHCNQGLVLAIIELVVFGILNIFTWIPFFGIVFIVIESLLGVVCLLFTILGIVNATSGQAKELPLIGKIRILK